MNIRSGRYLITPLAVNSLLHMVLVQWWEMLSRRCFYHFKVCPNFTEPYKCYNSRKYSPAIQSRRLRDSHSLLPSIYRAGKY